MLGKSFRKVPVEKSTKIVFLILTFPSTRILFLILYHSVIHDQDIENVEAILVGVKNSWYQTNVIGTYFDAHEFELKVKHNLFDLLIDNWRKQFMKTFFHDVTFESLNNCIFL